MFSKYNRLPIQLRNTRSFFTIVNAWEKGVRLGFGKYTATVESGLRLCIPVYHTVYKINMADRVQHLAKQSLISKDNVTFTIDSSVQYKVTDAKKSLLNVTNLDTMVIERCQMALRKVLSGLELNEILHDLEDTSTTIKASLQNLEEKWGNRNFKYSIEGY
jgi:regulator of protease activity HflC (stomatin/prohibitin superfamily)